MGGLKWGMVNRIHSISRVYCTWIMPIFVHQCTCLIHYLLRKMGRWVRPPSLHRNTFTIHIPSLGCCRNMWIIRNNNDLHCARIQMGRTDWTAHWLVSTLIGQHTDSSAHWYESNCDLAKYDYCWFRLIWDVQTTTFPWPSFPQTQNKPTK